MIGSCIANVLGAFSLGLILLPTSRPVFLFDRSSKIWALVQLLITTLAVPLFYLWQRSLSKQSEKLLSSLEDEKERLRKVVSVTLLLIFLVYLIAVGWAISRGRLDTPEESDSDSDSEQSSSPSSEEEADQSDIREPETSIPDECSPLLSPPSGPSRSRSITTTTTTSSANNSTTNSLPTFKDRPINSPIQRRSYRKRKASSLLSHLLPLIISSLALSLSGFLLSHSISSLATTLNLSNTVLGLTLLSFITTLPEKFLAGLSGSRGKSGILLASTAGSNIFLLSLCGSVSLSRKWDEVEITGEKQVTIKKEELAILWLASLSLVGIVFRGAKRWHGWVLMTGYLMFLVAELSAWRR